LHTSTYQFVGKTHLLFPPFFLVDQNQILEMNNSTAVLTVRAIVPRKKKRKKDTWFVVLCYTLLMNKRRIK